MFPEKTKPFFSAREWGGDRLRALYSKPIPDNRTGESWEISAHENGECEVFGLPLSKAVEQYGKKLMGDVPPPFPLLIKLLDARDNLSVQVHPDDVLAKAEGQPYGKTEAWVILDAPPGAKLILGIDCELDVFRAALYSGQTAAHLKSIPVKAGDTVFIPAGTVHALTGGIVAYEVQQSSDTTYRLHAWNRDVPLHKGQALRAMAIDTQGAGLVEPVDLEVGVRRLIDCNAFTLDRIRTGGIMARKTDGKSFVCYTALSTGEMFHSGGTIPYAAGDSILVPASAGKYALRGGELLAVTPVL